MEDSWSEQTEATAPEPQTSDAGDTDGHSSLQVPESNTKECGYVENAKPRDTDITMDVNNEYCNISGENGDGANKDRERDEFSTVQAYLRQPAEPIIVRVKPLLDKSGTTLQEANIVGDKLAELRRAREENKVWNMGILKGLPKLRYLLFYFILKNMQAVLLFDSQALHVDLGARSTIPT